jgi:hypothetical protein
LLVRSRLGRMRRTGPGADAAGGRSIVVVMRVSLSEGGGAAVS